MSIPTPSWGSSKLVSYDVAKAPLAGAYHRRKRSSIKYLIYTLIYNPGQLDTARANTLISQFNTVKGSAGTFSWTPWNSATAIDVRFADDDLTLNVATLVAFGGSIRLVKEPS